MNIRKNKVIVILGPTSSGKSSIAIRLAKKFNGEIISADSRQVYRGLDIGTGKVTGVLTPVILSEGSILIEPKSKDLVFISEGIPHYMIDIISPRTNFSAAQFKKKTEKIIANILKRGKLPIICGGTGFWIKTVVDDVNYPEVKPDWVLRSMLRNKSSEELFSELQKLDPERARTIDAKNKVRLIRAIEICKAIGKVPKISAFQPEPSPDPADRLDLSQRERLENYSSSPLGRGCRVFETGEGTNFKYEFLQIGINLTKEKLHSNIKKRLEQRFKAGMIKEVEQLHYKDKISWKRLGSFGLGYALIPKYLKACLPASPKLQQGEPKRQGEITSQEELFEQVYQAERNYAKRQMTWFKKDTRIKWLEKYKEIEKEAKNFLK